MFNKLLPLAVFVSAFAYSGYASDLIPASTNQSVNLIEFAPPVVSKKADDSSSYVYRNATNDRNSSLVLGKCDSERTKRRSFWLQSGIEKKELDNQWKTDTMKLTTQNVTETNEEVIGYFNGDPKYPHIVRKTVQTIGPTEATRALIEADRQKWEYNRTTIGNNVNSLLNATTGLVSFVRAVK